jgi:hypothetical protein
MLLWVSLLEHKASESGTVVGPVGGNRPGLGMLLIGIGRVISLWWLYEAIGRRWS